MLKIIVAQIVNNYCTINSNSPPTSRDLDDASTSGDLEIKEEASSPLQPGAEEIPISSTLPYTVSINVPPST